MLTSDHDALLVAHERARHLRDEATAERLRPASGTRYVLAAGLRFAANRLDPAPFVHRAA